MRALALVPIGLLLSSCALLPQPASTEPVAVAPTGIAFSAMPTTTPTGNGVAYLDGAAAVRQIRRAAASATWVDASIDFEQAAPAGATPAPTLHSYTATVHGDAETLDANLVIDGAKVDLHVRDGVILGYGDADTLTTLGFGTTARGLACLSTTQSAATRVLALVEPAQLLRTLLANPENPAATVFTGAETTDEHGDPAIEVAISTSQGFAGTLVASASGTPYPSSLTIDDASGRIIASFENWDKGGKAASIPDDPSDC
jgi:hypothetical protein